MANRKSPTQQRPVNHRKPKALRKVDDIHIRCTTDQKAALEREAAKADLGVSTWLLRLGLRAAGLLLPTS